jgi:hypothetical protein
MRLDQLLDGVDEEIRHLRKLPALSSPQVSGAEHMLAIQRASFLDAALNAAITRLAARNVRAHFANGPRNSLVLTIAAVRLSPITASLSFRFKANTVTIIPHVDSPLERHHGSYQVPYEEFYEGFVNERIAGLYSLLLHEIAAPHR